MSDSRLSVRALRMTRALEFITNLGTSEKAVLDIGCQSGGFCNDLAKLGHKPVGIEIMPDLIANARRDFPDLKFLVHDCSNGIPFPDSSFDVVWAGEVIEHIGHTDVFVNEINRVLKVGGYFILTTPMHNMIKNLYIALFKFDKHFDPEFPHYRFYTKSSLSNVLLKRGFEIDTIGHTGRISIVANTLFVAAKKIETKKVMSPFHA